MLPRYSAPGFLSHLRCVDSNKTCAIAFTTQKERDCITIVGGYDCRGLQCRGCQIIATSGGGEKGGENQKEEHRNEFRDNGFHSGDDYRPFITGEQAKRAFSN